MSANTLTTPTGVSEEQARRFYDRLRERVATRLGEKPASLLLLVPDVFLLLWRLVNDSRVNGANKVLLGSAIAYYFLPLDVVPELFLGPIGFVDDVIIGVYMLNRILADTDPAILREHWSGSEDVLKMIQRVLDAANRMGSGGLLEKLKKVVK
ncbi:MAG: YkvA family protein [Thermoanaerobaculia bacterium]